MLSGIDQKVVKSYHTLSDIQINIAGKTFYAQFTYNDQMVALLIGTLGEEGLINNTVIIFNSDHGEMLGDYGMFLKTVFYEFSCRIILTL